MDIPGNDNGPTRYIRVSTKVPAAAQTLHAAIQPDGALHASYRALCSDPSYLADKATALAMRISTATGSPLSASMADPTLYAFIELIDRLCRVSTLRIDRGPAITQRSPKALARRNHDNDAAIIQQFYESPHASSCGRLIALVDACLAARARETAPGLV